MITIRTMLMLWTSLPLLVIYSNNGYLTASEREVQEALSKLLTKELNRAKYTFDLDELVSINGARVYKVNGQLIYAQYDDAFFCDLNHLTTVYENSKPVQTDKTQTQYYMANGQRCLLIDYQLINKTKQVQNVICDPRDDYSKGLQRIAGNAKLDGIIYPLNQVGQSFQEIVSGEATQVTDTSATYHTRYGNIVVVLSKSSQRTEVKSIQLTQSRDSVYTSLSEGKTLGEVKVSVFDETPNGLDQSKHLLQFTYQGEGPHRHLASISSTLTYKAQDQLFTMHTTHKTRKYEKVSSRAIVEGLALEIPEGSKVLSLDPDFHSINLAFENRQVVREIDGVPLDVVIEEQQRSHRALYLAIGVAAVLLLVGTALYFYSRTTKSKSI